MHLKPLIVVLWKVETQLKTQFLDHLKIEIAKTSKERLKRIFRHQES